MRIVHWMKREKSGLAYTTIELAAAEEKLGHQVCIREPSGNVLYGQPSDDCDVELIHSQLPVQSYHNGKVRFCWMHGEPMRTWLPMNRIVAVAPAASVELNEPPKHCGDGCVAHEPDRSKAASSATSCGSPPSTTIFLRPSWRIVTRQSPFRRDSIT